MAIFGAPSSTLVREEDKICALSEFFGGNLILNNYYLNQNIYDCVEP